MTIVGFHASHEQVPPARLLHAVQRAEEAGFDAAMCSDHFAPWSVRQGESGFAWSWLGAALQATPAARSASSPLPASGTTRRSPRRRSPRSRRCSPAGSGPRSAAARRSTSTSPATVCPPKDERDARLRETVDRHPSPARGRGGQRRRAHPRRSRSHLEPARRCRRRCIGAAVSAETAARMRRAGPTASITVDQSRDALRAVIDAYRDAGGHGPAAVQVHLSWAPTDDEARAIAHDQWRTRRPARSAGLGPRQPEDVRRGDRRRHRRRGAPRPC